MTSQKFDLYIFGLSYALNSYMDLHVQVLSSLFNVELVAVDSLISGYKRRSLFSLPSELFQIFNYLSISRPKYIVTIGPKVGLLISLLSPLFSFIHIHWFTGQVWATSKRLLLSPSYLSDLCIAYSANHLFTDSPAQEMFLLKYMPLIRNKKINFPRHGSISYIPSTLFEIGYRRIQESYPLTESRVLQVGFLGRLCLEKGLDTIESLASDTIAFSNIRFKVCGPLDSSIGSSEPNKTSDTLTSLLDRLEINPRVTLCVGYIDRLSFFNDVDVLILPSQREGFGSVVVEANACGIPVIGSNIYGLSDSLVHGVNGFVASSYLDYIIYINLLSEHKLYSKFQKQSLDFSLRYSYDSMKDSLRSLYLSALL